MIRFTKNKRNSKNKKRYFYVALLDTQYTTYNFFASTLKTRYAEDIALKPFNIPIPNILITTVVFNEGESVNIDNIKLRLHPNLKQYKIIAWSEEDIQ